VPLMRLPWLLLLSSAAAAGAFGAGRGLPGRGAAPKLPTGSRNGRVCSSEGDLFSRLNEKTKAKAAAMPLRGGASNAGGGGSRIAVTFYATVGVGFAIQLARTLFKYPMLPFRPDSASWSFAWLITTVFDYYGAALCLCGVILSSEGPLKGVLWSLGCCLLGTPVCCMWVISRLLRGGGSLRIQP